MNVKIMCAAAGLAGAAVLVGQMKVKAFAGPDDRSEPGLSVRDARDSAPLQGQGSADVAVCSMPDWVKHGVVGSITAYSFGTTSVNVGSVNLNWIDGSPNHPVISQNMFRLKDGKFEQIGQSWLKHGFCALQLTGCGACAAQGGCLTFLKPGCRDPYSAGLNGSQGGLGPKFEVNAATGVFPWPYTASGAGGNTIYKRLQVTTTDLANAGALYFIEGHYVALDDSAAGNQNNNASYRRVNISGSHNLSFVGSTQQQKAGIVAWQDNDAAVVLTHIDVPDDGRFTLGHKVSDNGDGTWTYEYALYNMNSDRSGQAFRVPVPASVTLTNIGFHDVDYHSGEPYVGTDWTVTTGGGEIVWASETVGVNVNANALRWGTLYNFRFDADAAPTTADVVIDLFKLLEHGEQGPSSMTVSAEGPEGVILPCPTDVNGDGVTNVLDLIDLLLCFGLPDDPPCDTGQDVNGDGTINVLDLIDLLLEFGNTCP